MRQIRYFIVLLGAFLAKFRTLLFLSAVIGVVLILALAKVREAFPGLERGETIGLVGRFLTEDLPFPIQKEISIGLTRLDEEGKALPGLANTWYSEEDGKIWVFTLGDYKWQDGKPITASDINYKFTDVTSEVIDKKSIKFVLKDPFAPFPTIVSRPVFKRGFLGAGEWKVINLSLVGGRFIQSIKLINVKTKLVKSHRFYPTEESARLAFKLGEVDELREIVDPKDLTRWKNAKVEPALYKDRYAGVFINNEDPLLSEKNLRQALAYAINKDNFPGERAISPISPLSWAFNPQVKQYQYNTDRAKELLKALPDEQRKNLNINLVTTPTLLSIADRVKADWEAIGIKTHLQVLNTPPQDFQALIAIQEVPPDPDQYNLWHSTQTATNITRFRNTKESQRIDKLLEDGRRTLDQEERKKIYMDFQRFLLEESPVIFLFHPVTYTITRF